MMNIHQGALSLGGTAWIKSTVRWDLKDFMNWISSDNKRTKYKFLLEQYGYEKEDLENVPLFTQNMIYYPTNKLRFYVNKENVIKSGIINSSWNN